ncbi:uncharacterized protein EMH_0040680 [Eimeria mitis]|uniref:RTR1-type domain-containing protein n=1 Tax=Eimeria mitis TaxID=44415 RepID=U6KHD8_9EIME|nr:uncharacterized protein EMH_0040680 [Eimeria mitis]CDJ36216.1 hypothetical protein, conserved [Eimeria mitis]
MEESGEASAEASGDRGSPGARHRVRKQQQQQTQKEGAKDFRSLTDERAKALLEYRARCTSARFWVQSELLDLRVGGWQRCTGCASSDASSLNPRAGASVAHADGCRSSDPGIVGDLPHLIKQHLTCPLLSKLLQQDPVLSGKLATLDRVLWQRRSKHETQTPGWMSHEPLCPECCSYGVPQGTADVLSTAVTPAGANNQDSSRTSTMESVVGGEGVSAEGARPTRTVEDESRPVTAWVSCGQCMEHFAYIIASLLVFLKPSELRDLAVERQQSQCCGFVFCGRRNISTPEKRRAALWRWTLDFGGSKAISEDELMQFCCSRCCNRQQQLLRLLDEEPMYTRPGIKEWISDALERKAAYRPHPHGLPEEVRGKVAGEASLQEQQRQQQLREPRTGLSPRRSKGLQPAVEMDELLGSDAGRLMDPILEKRSSCVSFSTESSSAELTKLDGSLESESFRVPLTVDDESSADEAPVKASNNGDTPGACTVGEGPPSADHAPVSALGMQGGTSAPNSILLLEYGSPSTGSEGSRASVPTSHAGACEQSVGACASGSTKGGSPTCPKSERASTSSSPRRSSVCPSRTEGSAAAERQPEQRGEPSAATPGEKNLHTEAPFKARGSRVRFADDDDEDGVEGDGDGESAASVFKHFFNLQDEDDGPGFYARLERQAAVGSSHAAGSQTRNGTGELRSILKTPTEPVEPSPLPASSSTEAQVGYMRLSDVVIAFDLLSSCCTDASARFLANYHRRFCTCSCEGAPSAPGDADARHSDGEESPMLENASDEGEARNFNLRKVSEGDESDNVSCVDGESGDDIEPTELWKRRQQQLLKAILRSLPPAADNFIALITELCETLQPLQRRPPPCSIEGKAEGFETSDAAASFYFDDALTIAREEDIGLELVDFVRSTIHKSAPCPAPVRPVDMAATGEAAEAPVQQHEEKAVHVLLESIFSRMTQPIMQLHEPARPSVPTAP